MDCKLITLISKRAVVEEISRVSSSMFYACSYRFSWVQFVDLSGVRVYFGQLASRGRRRMGGVGRWMRWLSCAFQHPPAQLRRVLRTAFKA